MLPCTGCDTKGPDWQDGNDNAWCVADLTTTQQYFIVWCPFVLSSACFLARRCVYPVLIYDVLFI